VGEAPPSSLTWFVGVVLGLLAMTLWVWRSPENSPRHKYLYSAPLVWTMLVAGTVAVAQVRGYLFPYVVLWRSAIVIFVLAWITGVALANTTKFRQPMITVVAMGLFALNIGGAILPAIDNQSVTSDADNVHLAVKQAVDFHGAQPSDGPIMLRLGDGGFVGLYPALVYDFEERGIASGIEPGIEWVFGDRVLTEPASTVWFVCDTGTVFSLLADELGAQVVSSITPFDEIDEVTVRDLQVRLANQLRKVGHEEFLNSLESPLVSFALQGIDVDQDLVVELAEYNAFTPEPGFRFGVVAFPADAVPELWWSLNAVS
jgi:PIN domain nuclease of toxin-antitoxin system